MKMNLSKMKTLPAKTTRGFILITVLFLIAVLGVMAIVMSTTTSVQNLTTMYSLEQARGYAAAKSGLEYAIQRAADAGECLAGPSAVTLPGSSFSVNTTCTSVVVNESGTNSTVYQISSTATTGAFGNIGYVTRTVRSAVTI